jgi:hypothetical protein
MSACSFALNLGVCLPVFMENLPFQPPFLAGLGVLGGDVILACAWDLKTCIAECFDHHGTIRDQTHRYLITDPAVEFVPPLRSCRCFVDRLDLSRAVSVHRVSPAMRLVHQVAQAVEGAFIARRRDIEAAPTVQLHARRAEMQLDTILMAVPHPEAGVAVGIEAREGDLLETVDHLLLLLLVRRVLAGKADDTGAVGPFVRASVDQVDHAMRIAGYDLRQLACDGHGLAGRIADQIAIVVIGQHGAGGQILDRPRAAAFAVREKLDQHPGGLRCCAVISANRRSMPTSAAATRRASISLARPARVAVLSHRAIWLRFPP